MNKIVLGVIVIVIGGIVGWYYFGGKTNLPGMRIGDNSSSQSATGTRDAQVTLTQESPVSGTSKGGVGEDMVVTYTDTGYQPATVTVKQGTKVTFTNDSSIGMWTASGVHPTHRLLPGFDEKKSVTRGGTYEYTFTKIGSWQYHNHLKPTDLGIVIVTQ